MFNVSQSPLFIEMCQTLIEQVPTRYVPPSLEKIRTRILVKVNKEVDKIIDPIKSSWPSSNVSIVCDGWTDATHHPVINFIVDS